jgi:DNA polymerase-3 subunit delta
VFDFIELEEDIKRKKLHNVYVFCGADEALIKDTVNTIVNTTMTDTFKDLNYTQFDGTNVDIEAAINTCNTIPFMSEKKVVVIYRANFLGESEDREASKRFDGILNYAANPAGHCILILYYVFENDREKPSTKIKKLEKRACVVKFDKLKGAALEKKVKTFFDAQGKNIGKIELKYFCDGLENNMHIIKNEVDKLCAYVGIREITKDDVLLLLPPKTDNDIFDLVDNISQKKVEKALDILNELIFKGEKIPYILYMIERQFNILLQIKLRLEESVSRDMVIKEMGQNPFKMNSYICEKMISQSARFKLGNIKKAINLCLDTEKVLKSSSVNGKTELELLIINANLN